jgi:dipeptidyl-peptidase-4
MSKNTTVHFPAETYRLAESLLMGNLKQSHVFGVSITPTVSPGVDVFKYMVSGRDGPRLVQVDPENAIVHSAVMEAPPRMGEVVSPDGKWAAFERDYDLYLREVATDIERRITFDGGPDHTYARMPDALAWSHELDALGVVFPPSVVWSPDSSRLATHRIHQAGVEHLWWVASTPPGHARPRLRTKRFPMPGDAVVPTSDVIVVDVASGKVTDTGACGIPSPFMPLAMSKRLWFANEGRDLCVISADRFDRKAELLVIDAATGATRSVLSEACPTHLDFHPMMGGNNARLDGKTVVWWSERSGWGHLYRYDLETGSLLNQITSGCWLVHTVLAVDEAEGFVWFTGAGRECGDPYRQRLYRAPLAGGEPELLDGEDAHHMITPTGTGRYFIDTYSTLSDFGRTVLRDRAGKVVLTLETPDIGDLAALGLRLPQRVALTAADGVTQIWATIFLPAETRPGVRYPVLDDIYPGPQVAKCAPSLAAGSGFMGFGEAFSLVALGFIVVQIDGRGTPGRSKAFHDHSYGAIERSSDLDDHEAAIRQLAATLPLDLDRVGIFGASGGGYAAARAVLAKPDFYKAAVAMCGNHDQRILSSVWGETYQGPVDGSNYDAQDNATLAGNLKGKLLLIHGELDDNVTASHTLRLVNALIEADADFEMFIVPNAGHAFIGKAAFHTRRRWDFFVRHLLHAEPPAGYRLKEPPMEFWGG